MVCNTAYQMFPSHKRGREFSIDLEQHLSKFYLPGMVRHIFYILTQYMQKCVGMGVGVYLKLIHKEKFCNPLVIHEINFACVNEHFKK